MSYYKKQITIFFMIIFGLQIYASEDFSFLDILIESLETQENQIVLHQIAIKQNDIEQNKIEMKVYKSARKRVLHEQNISLSDFNSMNDEERIRLLTQAARDNAYEFYNQILNNNDQSSVSDIDETVLFQSNRGCRKKNKMYSADLYSQAIKIVLDEKNLTLEEFNSLSLYKKKSLLLNMDELNYILLPESEQAALAELQIQRDMYNENQKIRKINKK